MSLTVNRTLLQICRCSDPCEQLAYVAAFTISSYSTTSNRTGKPFNPLLGETYECDRTDDLGWKVINEQVSHHPPMVAQYCEGKQWNCWQAFTMTSKFRGKFFQVIFRTRRSNRRPVLFSVVVYTVGFVASGVSG